LGNWNINRKKRQTCGSDGAIVDISSRREPGTAIGLGEEHGKLRVGDRYIAFVQGPV